MHKMFAVLLLVSFMELAQEKIDYKRKRISPEIQQLEYRQWALGGMRQEIRLAVQATPPIIGGFYLMQHAFERDRWVLDNQYCFTGYAQHPIFTLCLGMTGFCVGFYPLITLLSNCCEQDKYHRWCNECGQMCIDESCHLLNYFSCNALYRLVKMAQRTLS